MTARFDEHGRAPDEGSCPAVSVGGEFVKPWTELSQRVKKSSLHALRC